MLSRVAENIFWMARYIERAENTARLINVNTNLLLDLPKSANVGWLPIIEILGSEQLFNEQYDSADERNVLRFIISDQKNTGSIVSSLASARENARTIRDIIPRETWERINDLFLFAKGNAQSGITRKHRYEFLSKIILGAQTITGQLAGTMLHDVGYDFLKMGRNLERADMTTRIIDVRSGDLLEHEHEALAPYESIQWMSVLKSLTAYQMYRRSVQSRVSRPFVLKFILKDREFPRAVYHTLGEVAACLENLPRNKDIKKQLAELQQYILDADPAILKQNELHKFIDEVQLKLIQFSTAVTDTYFKAPT
ncbi:MAG: alpha-E domain-containing protein [Gammaproteobacteria bacterium]|nr:alpha-E domain-containing protein [Gammaproteobacteria bacterium]